MPRPKKHQTSSQTNGKQGGAEARRKKKPSDMTEETQTDAKRARCEGGGIVRARAEEPRDPSAGAP